MTTTYLPHVGKASALAGQGDLCGMNDDASAFVQLWLAAIGDRAALMQCDRRLVEVAQAQADYLAAQPFDAIKDKRHIGPGGSSPNQRVRASGYALPDWWPVVGNQVESCTPASHGAAAALEKFRLSPAHKPMVWGEDWWVTHTQYGVGHSGIEFVLVCAPEVPEEGRARWLM